MKKITLLLMVFALAWSGQLKAVTLPETSKDGKVKWYFIQSMRQDYGEPMFYTVDGDLIRGRVKADYSDYATLAKQLWCFETEDGEWYTITNRYDGRKLGLDQRVVNPLLPDADGTKVNRCVDNVFRLWQKGADKS